jgi:MFS superfamily sulfate permease-like transporter
MPNAVLSSVVFLIGIELIDIGGMRAILRVRVDEFVIAAITAVVVLVVGVEEGILVAIIASLVEHVRRGYHPRDTVFVRGAGGDVTAAPVAPGVATLPGLVVYRFAASLYYANANRFSEEILTLADTADPKVRWLVVDFAAIADVDYSGEQTIRELHTELTGRGVFLKFVEVSDDVRRELDRYGITELVGPDAYVDTVENAVRQFEKEVR